MWYDLYACMRLSVGQEVGDISVGTGMFCHGDSYYKQTGRFVCKVTNYMTLPPSLEMKIEKKDDYNLSMTEIMEIIFSLEC